MVFTAWFAKSDATCTKCNKHLFDATLTIRLKLASETAGNGMAETAD